MNILAGSPRRGIGVVIGAMALGLALASPGASAVAPVGVKLLVQPWDPITDNDAVQTHYDSANAITIALNRTWDKARPLLVNTIKARLQTPNLLAKGVSLYDVKINISAPELSVMPDGDSGFIAKLSVRDTSLEATSTTPDIAFGIGLGSYADPRCSIRFALDLTLKLGVTDNKNRLLESRFGRNDKPVLISGFKADSLNASCDFAKWLASDVAKIFVGRDFWQWMTDEINNPQRPEYVQLNNGIKQELDAALGAINAQLQVPAQYARLRVWANPNKLTALFGVRSLPLPARNASASGRLVIADLKGQPLPIARCDQLQLKAMVKTGPSPLLDPSGTHFGDPPMVQVGQLNGGALPSGSTGAACDYQVSGLVPGFPNLLRFDVPGQSRARKHSTGNLPTVVWVLAVRPEGWTFDQALHPRPTLTGLNLTLSAGNAGQAGALESATNRYIDKGDPPTDRSRIVERAIGPSVNPATVNPADSLLGHQANNAAKQRASELNPQPLPPGPGPGDPERVKATAQNVNRNAVGSSLKSTGSAIGSAAEVPGQKR